MNKQAESRKLRRKLCQLYQEKLNRLESGERIQPIHAEINQALAQLFKLERETGKNRSFSIIDGELPEASPSFVSKFIGYCEGCGAEVFAGRNIPTRKDGLFHSYSCRDKHRRQPRLKQATG